MDEAKYKTTHWCDPAAGLVIKSETLATKAAGRDEVDGKRTVRTLSSIVYPEGTTTHALEPRRHRRSNHDPEYVGRRQGLRRVGRGEAL